eukprot:954635-Pelagomonas_calceolata.AAC.2
MSSPNEEGVAELGEGCTLVQGFHQVEAWRTEPAALPALKLSLLSLPSCDVEGKEDNRWHVQDCCAASCTPLPTLSRECRIMVKSEN